MLLVDSKDLRALVEIFLGISPKANAIYLFRPGGFFERAQNFLAISDQQTRQSYDTDA
jgi:hypothetical protein